MKTPSLFLAFLGGITLIMLTVPLAIIFNGFIWSSIWNLLAVPLFGFKPLNIPQAIAFGILATYFMPTPTTSKKGKELYASFIGSWIGKLLLLLMAWIIAQFI